MEIPREMHSIEMPTQRDMHENILVIYIYRMENPKHRYMYSNQNHCIRDPITRQIAFGTNIDRTTTCYTIYYCDFHSISHIVD